MVTMSGVTWRITMVAEGLVGNSCGILDGLSLADSVSGVSFGAFTSARVAKDDPTGSK
jgi:hypothetical protein